MEGSGPAGKTKIRRGNERDASALLQLFDEAVAWLAQRGQGGQWGTEPWSTQPRAVDTVKGLASKDLWVQEVGAKVVGALVVGSSPEYVSRPAQPELYVMLVITSRRWAGHSLGSQLIEHAETLASQRGLSVLRVDCWAGAPDLVGWYESQGFAKTENFDLRGWQGQVLAKRCIVGRAAPS